MIARGLLDEGRLMQTVRRWRSWPTWARTGSIAGAAIVLLGVYGNVSKSGDSSEPRPDAPEASGLPTSIPTVPGTSSTTTSPTTSTTTTTPPTTVVVTT